MVTRRRKIVATVVMPAIRRLSLRGANPLGEET